MQIRSLVLSAVVTLSPLAALAHGDHEHPKKAPPPPAAAAELTEDAVKLRAQDELTRLAEAGKIDASWKEAGKLRGVEKKKSEWLVTFDHPTAKEKKVLYVFLKPSGEFVAANHTGK
jgi:alkylhydroperoxidase family enzyme